MGFLFLFLFFSQSVKSRLRSASCLPRDLVRVGWFENWMSPNLLNMKEVPIPSYTVESTIRGLVKFERVGLLRREVKVMRLYLFTICFQSLLSLWWSIKECNFLKETQHWQWNIKIISFRPKIMRNWPCLRFRIGRFPFPFFLLPFNCSFVDKTTREDQVKKLKI